MNKKAITNVIFILSIILFVVSLILKMTGNEVNILYPIALMLFAIGLIIYGTKKVSKDELPK
ncbi:MAG: NADH:ubiquinone oxidoreductase subunit K [Flammeovirgaceae bacterium]|jgi:NADH:ubiquinone oxidoreductase subunit K